MSAIDEFRRQLSLFQCELMNLLGSIAEAEDHLNKLKKEVVDLYERNDNLLDLEIKHEH